MLCRQRLMYDQKFHHAASPESGSRMTRARAILASMPRARNISTRSRPASTILQGWFVPRWYMQSRSRACARLSLADFRAIRTPSQEPKAPFLGRPRYLPHLTRPLSHNTCDASDKPSSRSKEMAQAYAASIRTPRMPKGRRPPVGFQSRSKR